MTYGAYVNELLNDNEKAIFQEFYDGLHKDFVMNESSDRKTAELACLYFVRLLRAMRGDNAGTINAIDLLLSRKLSELKATKDKREGGTVTLKTTPAEWAAALLVKYGYREYPPIADQLEAIWDVITPPSGLSAEEIKNKIEAVKAKYPKPGDGHGN